MTEKTTVDPSRLEVSVAKQEKTSVDLDGGKSTARTESTGATTIELGDDLKVTQGLGDGDGPEDDIEEGSDEKGSEGGDEDSSEAEGSETVEDLGEYDPQNEEVKAKFDARYFTEGGELNKDALGSEFWANYAKGNASLNEATYDYLKDTLGVSKEFVKSVEEGLVAAQEKREGEFYSKVGGKEAFEAAVKWGKEGGYTKEQQDRFNAALNKGGADAEDAVEALMSRFQKASGKAPEGRRGPPRRSSAPKRDVTSGSSTGASANEGYSTRAEYSEAFNTAYAAVRAAQSTADKRKAEAELETIRAKGRRSRFKD